MSNYRGPHAVRIGAQYNTIMGYHGETGTWRQYVSGATANASAYYAGAGTTLYYREQTITALWDETRFRETQLPGGQVMAGDAIVSTPNVFGSQDELIWRGVTYRIEGDSTPIHMQGRVWYRTVLRRGDVTG